LPQKKSKIDMMKNFNQMLWAIGLIVLIQSCTKQIPHQQVTSPDGKIKLSFELTKNGEPNYQVFFNDQQIVKPSKLGFDFKNQPAIKTKWTIETVNEKSIQENWEMPWGEKRLVANNYNALTIGLNETKAPHRKMNLLFKVYNDGIGFRYEFPKQDGMDTLYINEENTEFNLTQDYKAFWIPGDWDIYEHLYKTTALSKINAVQYRSHNDLAQTYIPNNAVNTPVTMVGANGLHLSFHEANLTDYSDMTLKVDTNNLSLLSCLVGSKNHDYKVIKTIPFVTPWRTIQISKDAAGLIESDLIVNLNEPNKIGDVSYFKPMKYVGIWWDMHLGRKTWDYAASQDMNSASGKIPHGKHGATTAYAKELIDFAAAHNIGGLLVEGWNTGWEHWIGFEDREGVFDFVTPYPDYDLSEVVRYGKAKGVELIMHHETSAATKTYSQQLDTAYSLMESLGIHAVKTGYVGKILPKGEYHHGQYMVNHYHKVLETGAKYHVAINTHEPIKATGKRRTYPNAISREGLRGQEFNAWASDGGNPPEHLPIVAFTRMLAGPIDYTPGIFNIKLTPYKDSNQVNTTLCQQLALYVIINSPIQMAADLIEYYKNNPAFQFIVDVPVNWEQSKVLNGEVGDYVTIARQERNSDNWFIGGITDEKARNTTLNFDFLPQGKTYEATLYRDAETADWDKNPTAYKIDKLTIDNTTTLPIKMAAGGGFAISLFVK
jgi:hypothetical protein